MHYCSGATHKHWLGTSWSSETSRTKQFAHQWRSIFRCGERSGFSRFWGKFFLWSLSSAYCDYCKASLIQKFTNVLVNPIENTLETSWKDCFEALLAKAEEDPFQQVLRIILANKYLISGPLLTLLPAFHHSLVQTKYDVYAEVINKGKNIAGLLASNWLRLDVKEG